jgi:hypothetical protein
MGEQMLDLAEGKFGHRLGQLLAKAENVGLTKFVSLSKIQREAIRRAETYYAGKLFEYPAVGEALSSYPQMPSIEELFGAAELLVVSLAKPCNDAS